MNRTTDTELEFDRAEERYEELWRAAAALLIEVDFEKLELVTAEPLRRILEWRR